MTKTSSSTQQDAPSFQIEQWQQSVESHFTAVNLKTMGQLPISNPKIEVELATLKEIRTGVFLGVMVTPWFINLIVKIVNKAGNDRHNDIYQAKLGEKVTLKFPSGAYEFIVNHNDALGYFYTCALISDMHTIDTHKTARQIALESLPLVFDEEAKELTTREKDIRAISMGTAKLAPANKSAIEGHTQDPKVEMVQTLEKKMETPVSRRSLFGIRKAPLIEPTSTPKTVEPKPDKEAHTQQPTVEN